MSKKATTRKPLFGNKRSHALNTTKHTQKLNIQKVTMPDGKTILMSVREAKRFKKDEVSNQEVVNA